MSARRSGGVLPVPPLLFALLLEEAGARAKAPVVRMRARVRAVHDVTRAARGGVRGVRRRKRGRAAELRAKYGRGDLLPVELAVEDRRRARGDDGVQVDAHDRFDELRDERVAAVRVLALPAPAEARDHVEREANVLQRDGLREAVDLRDVPVEDHHGRDVQWDRRGEEGDVWEADELTVHDDHVVRGDDGCEVVSMLF